MTLALLTMLPHLNKRNSIDLTNSNQIVEDNNDTCKKKADTETVTCLVLSENNFNPHVIPMTIYAFDLIKKKSKISRKNIHVNISPYTTIQSLG